VGEWDQVVRAREARERRERYSGEVSRALDAIRDGVSPAAVPGLRRVKFTARPSITTKLASGVVVPKPVGDRTYRFIASDSGVDRDRDTLAADGWDLDAYRANPVVLLAHDAGSLPVARAANVAVSNGALVVDIEFPPAGTSAASDQACALVAGGYLRAVSVGFLPLEWSFNEERGGRDYTSIQLLEISLVAVPSNPRALISASMGGRR